MGKSVVDLDALSREEQLDLLDRLWDVLGRDPAALPLSDEQRTELDKRLDAFESGTAIGLTWDETVELVRSHK